MPIQLKSKKRIESIALPGAAFTVRRLSRIRRASRDLDTIDAQVKVSRLMAELRGIFGEIPQTEFGVKLAALPDDQRQRATLIDYEVSLLLDKTLKPASIRTALISVEGVTDEDGIAVDTADKLLAAGTPELDELIEEIYRACEAAGGLDAEEIKN